MFGRVFGIWLALVAGAASATELPMASDLRADARHAARYGTPILVFFAADSCPFCHQVEDLHLRPMHVRGTYGDRVLIRVVRTERAQAMTDFDGRRTDHGSFARREGATFTPTVRLYGPGGQELARPIIGYSADFYSGMLEQAIDDALARLRSQAQAGSPSGF
ncbi:hypothetical protein SVA_0503 [Sulfurifustis variabilis]|uniref:Thioredoxin-like fold domain-containing protein n=1 Tax=Sulfurifustis variabilis TaxID=1675686 RepID=A0A1B4V709_9GAMM|nr:thioredoxin fold domain-containing protein [Sulfurifustis variabilis]BAU47084.1 hypothetical protein SVA_0503 [Sulfurifustis variabilis]